MERCRKVFDRLQRFFISGSTGTVLWGLVLAGAAGPASAALGKTLPVNPANPVSVAAPSSALSPSAKLLATSPQQAGQVSYTVFETLLDGGTTVREYAASAGPVFAISWSGPVLPELGTLLGDYFSTFKLETGRSRAQGRRGSPFVMDRDGLVVRSSGRMGSFSGYAYAPDLVPAGVNIKDVVQ